MTLVDDSLRSLVRRSVDEKLARPEPHSTRHAVAFTIVILMMVSGVVLLSDLYADYRVADYMEFHRMMQDAGR